MIRLTCPLTDKPLAADSPHSLCAAGRRWPVVAGIPYLRLHREALRREALAALDLGDEDAALALLLADQDDFAPLPPPEPATLHALVSDAGVTFRDAMAALNFGPVASYFAHRWSAPTFLSGLALIALYATPHRPVLEVCCGTGQLLREVELRGGTAIGVDLVFAKLWLGKRYLDLKHLVCADAAVLPVEVSAGTTVLNHDALYFIPDVDKPLVIAAMARAANGGALLAGHLHVAGHPHGGERAYPMSLAGWEALLPDAATFDDAALTSWFVSEGASELAPLDPSRFVGAVSLAHGLRLAAPMALWQPASVPLTKNPLLVPDEDGGLVPRWPSEAFADEYAGAHYLNVPDAAALEALPLEALHARRSLLPLPARW